MGVELQNTELIQEVIHWDMDGNVSVQNRHQIDDSSKHTSKYQNIIRVWFILPLSRVVSSLKENFYTTLKIGPAYRLDRKLQGIHM